MKLRFVWCLGLMVVALFSGSGCAHTAMKGTPFYTGEWEERIGPVEDRVALWPLVYYRAPALSVLWPIFEMTPDHIAVRPFYGVRGRTQGQRVHRVLWPLGEFNTALNRHRFFPVYWGEEYFHIFPLYWHHGKPFSEGAGVNALFPLWIYSSRLDRRDEGSPRHRRLHLLWPLARFARAAHLSTDRVFPLYARGRMPDGSTYFCSILYGRYRDEHERFLYTPLYLQGRNDTEDWRWHAVVPLYYRRTAPGASTTITPLGGCSRRADGTRTVVSPVYIQNSKGPDRELTLIPPLLSWQSRQPERTDLHILGPFSRFSRGEVPRPSYAFALYYHNPASRTLLTPLFQKGGTPDSDRRWHAMVPLYYRSTSEVSSTFITPLGGVTRRTDGTGRTVTPLYVRVEDSPDQDFTLIPPLLSWQSRRPERTDLHILGPFSRFSRGEVPRPSYAFPLYYHNPVNRTLLTPLFQKGGTPESDRRWHAMVPLYYRQKSDAASVLVTPLGGVTRRTDGTGRTVTPLYVHVEDQPGETLTGIPPLLSWRTREPGRTDDWLLLGLAHSSRGEDRGASHLFPLVYRNPASNVWVTPLWARWHKDDQPDTVVSPAYASWASGDKKVQAIPPLLSWRTREPGRTDDWLLLGLAHSSRGIDRGASHLFPLVYRNPASNVWVTPLWARWHREDQPDTVVSPVYASWASGDKQVRAIPPLLSWQSIDSADTRRLNVLAGLYSHRSPNTGPMERSHLLPVYVYSRNRHLYTPVYGRDAPEDGSFTYWLTPLAGTYRNRYHGGWIWPLFRYRGDEKTGRREGSALLLGRHEGDQNGHATWLFPLFSHRYFSQPPAKMADDSAARNKLPFYGAQRTNPAVQP